MTALAGGVEDAGWLSRFDLLLPLVGAPVDGRPRFFVLVASFDSSIIALRPPMLARYSSSTVEAFSLGPFSNEDIHIVKKM